MVYAARRSSLLEGTWRTPKTPSVGHPMGWTNKFTLLADPGRGFGGVAAGEWSNETGRRQRLVGIHHPGGERRLLFGVGEGPTKAIAEAKQGRTCVQSSTTAGEQGSGGLPLVGWELEALDRSYQSWRPGARQSARQRCTSDLRLIYG